MMLLFKSAWFSQQNVSEKIVKKFLASDLNSGSGEREEPERHFKNSLKYCFKQFGTYVDAWETNVSLKVLHHHWSLKVCRKEKDYSFGKKSLDSQWLRSGPENRNRLLRWMSIYAFNTCLFNTYYVPDTKLDANNWMENKIDPMLSLQSLTIGFRKEKK